MAAFPAPSSTIAPLPRRVMIVDADTQTRNTLRTLLVAHGYQVAELASGQDALEYMRLEDVDLVILESHLPDIGGIELCAGLRVRSRVPVMMLSVASDESLKIEALRAGADDYLTRPFSPTELLARMESKLRRYAWASERGPVLHLAGGTATIDLGEGKVVRDGGIVHLTPLECAVLEGLARKAGTVVPRGSLLRFAMGGTYEDATGALRVHVLNLRRKLEADPSDPRALLTVAGVGYRLSLASYCLHATAPHVQSASSVGTAGS